MRVSRTSTQHRTLQAGPLLASAGALGLVAVLPLARHASASFAPAPLAALSAALCATGILLTLKQRRRPVVGLAMGVYDFCHRGHVAFLERAAARCDRLVIGVHTDAFAGSYKSSAPANSERERALAVHNLGIAHDVVVESDRAALCRRFGVSLVFHGDDWDPDAYRKWWGEERIRELGIELVMLPHTPDISSTALRERVPPLGWWLYSQRADWDRSHIFDHLTDLYGRLGGIWFLAGRGRELVSRTFPDSPRVLIEDGKRTSEAARAITSHPVDVMITAQFNYDRLLDAMTRVERPLSLIVLSHGRSGKPGTSAGVQARRLMMLGDVDPSRGLVFREGNVTVHDWSYVDDGYVHFDRFLREGGSFTNPVPVATRPRVLIVPTWSPDVEERGLLLSRRWHAPLHELGRTCELLLSPHPLADRETVARFAGATGATVLEGRGRTFARIPDVHCAVCDLSGAFWEALAFDTPVVLAETSPPLDWPDTHPPARSDLVGVVSVVTPERVVDAVSPLLGSRRPQQHALAERRLGKLDGKAGERLAARARAVLEDVGKAIC